MIEDLKPYPAYKDSGLPWLKEVPEQWEIRRGKALFGCIDVRSATGEEELLTVSSERGVVPRQSATVTMFKAESYVGYKLCWPGDLVINSLWAWACGLGVSSRHGIVSSAYDVYRLLPGFENYSSFIHELVRSAPFQWELQVRSKGIWISRLQLTDEAFLRSPFPLPPAPEQLAIVRFLDYADRRIRRYIRAKQKLIALLNEQKQAIIHRAVTRGLDRNAGLKDSGVEWLGDIPAHWEVHRIGFCLIDSRAGVWGDDVNISNSDDHIVCIRVADFRIGDLKINEKNLTVRAVAERARRTRLLEPGDILLEKSGGGDAEPVGRVVLFDLQIAAINSNFITRLRPNRELIEPEFLLITLASIQATRRQVPFIKQTTGIQNLDERAYLTMPIALPPLDEQRLLLKRVGDRLSPLRVGITQSQREINLLREYNTRLIADVITGKLDVREAANRLPEETGEPEGIEDLGVVTEGDEELEGEDLESTLEEVEA